MSGVNFFICDILANVLNVPHNLILKTTACFHLGIIRKKHAMYYKHSYYTILAKLL